MSWFDTAGLASFAKTALKEAQKQIDKALDIQDDDETSSTTKNRKPPETSKTEPSTPSYGAKPTASIPTSSTSVWGSFSGEESINATRIHNKIEMISSFQVPTSRRSTTGANRQSPRHPRQAPGSRPQRMSLIPWTSSPPPPCLLRCNCPRPPF